MEKKTRKQHRPLIFITAKRWFDRKNGNTYHTAAVNVDGKWIGSETVFGYGDAYLQTAHSILQKAGYYPKTGELTMNGFDKDYSWFLEDMKDYRDKFILSVSDVARKRDL